MKTLVIDNYDSFTYNLVQILEELTGDHIPVCRNDQLPADLDYYERLVLSPGPGVPDQAGQLKAVIEQYADSKKILGVCLGHQAIGEVFGAKLRNLDRVYHGVATDMLVSDPEEVLFKGIGKRFQAGRYHSWVIDKATLPSDLEVTAVDEKGEIMALSHREYPVKGVQFHPESILSPSGRQLIQNFLHL